MELVLWIIVAVVAIVLPAATLTSGGKREPERIKLIKRAQQAGLALPDALVPVVVERIRRREKGMVTGGVTGIVLAAIIYLVFFRTGGDLMDYNNGVAGFLVVFGASIGVAFGGAWAIIAHRPTAQSKQPVVARIRSVGLNDYVSPAERFGLWATPVAVVAGGIVGAFILLQMPDTGFTQHALVGTIVTALALLTWGISMLTMRQILLAPARSGSDLELAWDDAERADALRQVMNQALTAAVVALMFCFLNVVDAVTADGFYRDNYELSVMMSVTGLAGYGVLAFGVAAGPLIAMAKGTRRGYEQGQLWSGGATS